MGQVEQRHPVGVVPAYSSGGCLSLPAERAGVGTCFQGKPHLEPQDSSWRSPGLSQAVGGRCVAVLEDQCVPLALSLPCVVPVDKELGLGSDQGQLRNGSSDSTISSRNQHFILLGMGPT